MNQPSEEAKYLASWLSMCQDDFQRIKYLPYDGEEIEINEEKLAECIDEYIDSRR
jgi:hypothetical protein